MQVDIPYLNIVVQCSLKRITVSVPIGVNLISHVKYVFRIQRPCSR